MLWVLINHYRKCFKLEDVHAEVLPKYIRVPCLGLILAGGGAYLPPGVGQGPAQRLTLCTPHAHFQRRLCERKGLLANAVRKDVSLERCT